MVHLEPDSGMDIRLENPVADKPTKPFLPWVWIPIGIMVAGCAAEFALSVPGKSPGGWAAATGLLGGFTYFGLQSIGRLFLKQWIPAGMAVLRLLFLVPAIFVVTAAWMFSAAFDSTEDHFADNLKMPEGIEIAVPSEEAWTTPSNAQSDDDTFQAGIREALAKPGGDDEKFAPSVPSLRRASKEFPKEFRDYIDAAPEWGGFPEQGNRFAARRWKYGGEYRDTLHGYHSEFNGKAGFQTRCLLCLDKKQWSRYEVQTVPESAKPIAPEMTVGNNLDANRVMIDCDGVWLELYEESGTRERRVTKATLRMLEHEFAEFLKNPAAAVAAARQRSRDIALATANKTGVPLMLQNGMQPGMYVARYTLNPGEPGLVYLKAFEVTQGTPLSTDSLRAASEKPMTWSKEPSEKFGAKAGFMIYEGDWGKPYAARFEVWFKPESGAPERKLAESVFKIEGWMR